MTVDSKATIGKLDLIACSTSLEYFMYFDNESFQKIKTEIKTEIKYQNNENKRKKFQKNQI